MSRRIKILIGLLVFLLLVGLGGALFFILRRPSTKPTTPTAHQGELVYWRLFDEPGVFEPILEAYQAKQPEVKIQIIKKDLATYEAELTSAFAAGTPPDLFQIRSDNLIPWARRAEPLPEDFPFDELVPAAKKTFELSAKEGETLQTKRYAVPLSVDSLALFVNRDLLANETPKTWDEVVLLTEQLRQRQGTSIIRAGIALGGGNTVAAAPDIVQLLMLQNHTSMTSADHKRATFAGELVTAAGEKVNPGLLALDFYTSFARPGTTIEVENVSHEPYTWDNRISSVQAFTQGKAVMMLGYSYHISQLRNLAPTLNFEVVPAPQIRLTDQRTDFGIFFGEAVARGSANKAAALDFMKFLLTKEAQNLYRQGSGRPPSRLDLSGELKTDPQLGAFAAQAPTVKSWFRPGSEIAGTMTQMIESVITQGITPKIALETAERAVTERLLFVPFASQEPVKDVTGARP